MNDPSQTTFSESAVPLVQNVVRTRIPTRHGEFFLYYYNNTLEEKEHLAIVRGQVEGARDVAVRLHSECLTGDVFGSLRCDCGDQLDRALRLIGQESCGVLLYLRQEGRGIGLLKKLQAYNLQDEGLDTVEANIRLGHLSDERDYRIAAAILQDLGIESVRLITNNPAKIDQLRNLGVEVSDRISIEIPFNAENEGYLRTKARKMQHLLSFKVRQSPNGEFSFIEPLQKRLDDHRRDGSSQPFVSAVWAQGLDGGVVESAALDGFCSERARRFNRFLEARHDAVMTMADHNRDYVPSTPHWVVFGATSANFPPTLSSRTEMSVTVVTHDAAPSPWHDELTKRDVDIVYVGTDAHGRVDLEEALFQLGQRGLRCIVVEGQLAKVCMLEQRADHVAVTLVARFAESSGGRQPTAVHSGLSLAHCQFHMLDRDIVLYGNAR